MSTIIYFLQNETSEKNKLFENCSQVCYITVVQSDYKSQTNVKNKTYYQVPESRHSDFLRFGCLLLSRKY